MEETECSETSAYKIQTPGNYPEESIEFFFFFFFCENGITGFATGMKYFYVPFWGSWNSLPVVTFSCIAKLTFSYTRWRCRDKFDVQNGNVVKFSGKHRSTLFVSNVALNVCVTCQQWCDQFPHCKFMASFQLVDTMKLSPSIHLLASEVIPWYFMAVTEMAFTFICFRFSCS